MHIYLGQRDPPPTDHICMEYCLTKKVSQIAQCTYTKAPSLPTDHRSMVYHYTKYVSHIAECTYTREHAPPLQLTIDVWNTATPKKFHIFQNSHIPRPPPAIDHRSMVYHYTNTFNI